MIAVADLHRTAREYLRAAKLLRTHKSYDAAVYLCGYAVEIALKARICRTLKWTTGFPQNPSEFQDRGNLKTHDFQALLNFTGVQARIRRICLLEWSIASRWRPEQRYDPAGTKTLSDVNEIIAATQVLLRVLL